MRATGSNAYIVSKTGNKVIVKYPSKKTRAFHANCRATIGKACGGGRTDKPLVKAGNKHKKERARGHLYPVVRGVAMNASNHPHGGSQHHSGSSTTVSRNAPPGRKVGHIAAKRTGRKKR